VEKLPLILVIADNQYAYSTPTARQYACHSLVERAAGYGIDGHAVDGTDLQACLEVLGQAVKQARAGQGPQLVVGSLLRLCGHGEHDDAHYVDPVLRQATVGRDCMKVAENQLVKNLWAAPSDLETWRKEAVMQVEEAVAKAQREPPPDPYKEDWTALSSRHLLEPQPKEI
jgi:pyruvate dehydrogenase E1 component alpha subunit/2-oxoisovalerate dehydrogenase E1 component alpha subunit